MSNITELEAKYQELGREIEKLKTKGDYPKFFKHRAEGYIVKFTGLERGEVVFASNIKDIGVKSDSFRRHTNTGVWEEIPHDKTTGFYHKQLVWCWDTIWTHLKQLRFYDTHNNCSFYWDGTSNSAEFDNYEPYDWSCAYINKWAVKAVQTLKNK